MSTKSPSDHVKTYMFDQVLKVIRDHESFQLLPDGTRKPLGLLKAAQFPVIADKLARYMQSLLLENWFNDGRKCQVYYYKLGPYFFRVLTEQDPAHSLPYFIATTYEHLPVTTAVYVSILHIIDVNIADLLREAPNIGAMPQNIQSVMAMMVKSFADVITGAIQIHPTYADADY
jgi:hypothetical protein